MAYQIRADLEQIVFEDYQISADLEQQVGDEQYQISADLQQQVFEDYQISADLEQQVFDGTTTFGASTVWALKMRVAGVDISSNLTGILRIDARAGAARIADLAMEPAAGPVNPGDWLDAAVTIDLLLRERADAEYSTHRIFTGSVDLPEYDPIEGLVTLRCTDGLQAQMERAPRATIDAITPAALWHAKVFNDDADGWEYHLDRMSTIPYSYDLDGARHGHLTAWAAAVTPDWTYTAEDFDYGSLITREATARDLHNEVRIAYQYRFERLRQRDLRFGWRYPYTFCQYIATPSTLPTKDMIRGAAEGTGWMIRNLRFTPLWTTDPAANCGGDDFSWSNNQPEVVIGASLRLARRWSQTITEEHAVTIRAPQSINTFGTIARDTSGGFSSDYDFEEWEGANANNSLAVRGDRADLGQALNNEESYAPPDDAVQDENGDWWVDAGDRGEFEDAIEVVMAKAATEMRAAHRQNTVTWRAPINPALELYHTVRIESDRVTAQGKVEQLVHTLNIDTGEATTEIQIAISRSGTGSPQDQTLVAPAQPDSLVTLDPAPEAPTLGTQLGGLLASPVHDEDQDGYSGNHQLASTASPIYEGIDPDTGEIIEPDVAAANAVEPGSYIYPIRFQITMPKIEAAVRDAITAEQARAYTITIPHEELTIEH